MNGANVAFSSICRPCQSNRGPGNNNLISIVNKNVHSVCACERVCMRACTRLCVKACMRPYASGCVCVRSCVRSIFLCFSPRYFYHIQKENISKNSLTKFTYFYIYFVTFNFFSTVNVFLEILQYLPQPYSRFRMNWLNLTGVSARALKRQTFICHDNV